MRVDNLGPVPPNEPIRPRRGTTIGSKSSSSTSSTSDSAAARESPLAVSPETAELLAQLRELPEVREDVVQEIQRRIKNGEYFTPEAAKKTAQALLIEMGEGNSSVDTLAGW